MFIEITYDSNLFVLWQQVTLVLLSEQLLRAYQIASTVFDVGPEGFVESAIRNMRISDESKDNVMRLFLMALAEFQNQRRNKLIE